MEKVKGQRVLTDFSFNVYLYCIHDGKGIVDDVECRSGEINSSKDLRGDLFRGTKIRCFEF